MAKLPTSPYSDDQSEGPTRRLAVAKTFKLYVGGAFPRSESGRSIAVLGPNGESLGHACKASRKDLRDAVGAARKAQPGWAGATAYNRGQVLYRMAEMVEGKADELAGLLALDPARGTTGVDPYTEVTMSVDRLVAFAGWADKYAQICGRQNAVAGPYWNISVPQPTGVVGVVCPAELPLLALVSLVAPPVCAGNATVVLSPAFAPVVSVLGEALATSDLPGGVINLLTGELDELVPVLAKHRDVDAIHSGPVSADLARILREGTADNLKRVAIRKAPAWLDATACQGPGWIEDFVETKTVWHPVGA